MFKALRKWSQETESWKVEVFAWICVALMAGCYIYMGSLFGLLFK